MACYLLCWAGSGRLGNERHQATHYLGWAPDDQLGQRIAEHAAGLGARITAVAVARGFTLTVTRIWPGETRADERRHKSGAHPGRLCPLCRAAKKGATSR
jgi:hypothetical protein